MRGVLHSQAGARHVDVQGQRGGRRRQGLHHPRGPLARGNQEHAGDSRVTAPTFRSLQLFCHEPVWQRRCRDQPKASE